MLSGMLQGYLCHLKLKSLFYSKNQIIQKAETAAVVDATEKSTKLETSPGTPEEIVTQDDQIHVTHEKVMISCRVIFFHSSIILSASHPSFLCGS